MKRIKRFFNAVGNGFEYCMYPVVDVVLVGALWVGGGLAIVIAALAGAGGVIISILCSIAVPALCLVAIWGILHYFGVI